MPTSAPHLFADISSHGFGHLAQAAPILEELRRRLPELRLTVRCALPAERLRARLSGDFVHLEQRSDFGYVMLDAVDIDLAASAAAYREQHADWARRVADEAALLAKLQPDLVLTDVAYLPLAGAASAGIPALSMCSLNWADLFAHFFADAPWAAPIHRQMLAAYNSAEAFLRLTPGMPMGDFPRLHPVAAPVARLGRDCRAALRARLGCPADEKLVLLAFGGFDKEVHAAHWPYSAGLRWLVPQDWTLARADMCALESFGLPFTDLLRSVDAVLTKPGYGTFAEAACNGTPLLYVRRGDWPEQDCLIDWLKDNARCREVDMAALLGGNLRPALDALWRQEAPPVPRAEGGAQVADYLFDRLTRGSRNA
jgi:hypothetical protein